MTLPVSLEGSLPAGSNPLGSVLFDPAIRDAFGRLQVSPPVPLFDSQFTYGDQTLQWETVTTTGGSAAATLASGLVTMTVNTTSGASVIRQTRQYLRYQPGRSQLILLTFVFGTAVPNVLRLVGYGDASNGMFFQQANDGTLQFVLRRAGTDTLINQSAWNIDRLNGRGADFGNPSGITLDITKAQIFWLDFEALYVGTVRFGFYIGGQRIICHEQHNANILTTSYIVTANLPLRYQLTATGVTAGATLLHICGTVFSEGGFAEDRMYPFAAGNGTTGIAVTTRRAILSIRPKALLNTLTNRALIIPSLLAIAGTSAAARVGQVELVYNPTFTTGGGALTWTSADALSAVEYCVHGDANAGAFTNGSTIRAFPIASANSTQAAEQIQIDPRLPLTLDSAGNNPIALSVVVTATGALTCYAGLNWRELF